MVQVGKRDLECPPKRHPFTPAEATPATKYRWKATNSTRIGTIAVTLAAMSGGQSVWNSFLNATIPIGIVYCDLSCSRTDAQKRPFHDPWKVSAEVYRVLKPGGKGLFVVPFIYKYHGAPFDFFRYTKSGFHTLLRQYAVVEIFLCNETMDPNVCWKVMEKFLRPKDARAHPVPLRIGPV